jgi:hypothetical protein
MKFEKTTATKKRKQQRSAIQCCPKELIRGMTPNLSAVPKRKV